MTQKQGDSYTYAEIRQEKIIEGQKIQNASNVWIDKQQQSTKDIEQPTKKQQAVADKGRAQMQLNWQVRRPITVGNTFDAMRNTEEIT